MTAPSRSARQLGELFRFVIVGGSAVAVDFVVYFAIVTALPLFPTSPAKAISFIAGACLAFVFNRGFVFRSDGRASSQLGPFVVLYLVSLGLNNLVNAMALGFGLIKPLAWLFATGTSTVSNFLGMKFVVFRKSSRSAERTVANEKKREES